MVNLRDFQREFARHRKAAARGEEVRIAGREGLQYVFKRVDSSDSPSRKTFGSVAGRHAGVAAGAHRDLATNKAHLKNFGRDRKR